MASRLETQLPWQSCFPAGQTPSHDRVVSTQTSPQSRRPGQATPHLFPSHVAMPFMGTGQGAQDVPQVAGSLLLTQVAPQRWYPAWQVTLLVDGDDPKGRI